MITPNIAPRKIMGSAAAGLFSAAKSSVRRMENTIETISKSSDVKKEQKLGINYVQFFGSKKNAKILKKSLKTIRDSLVATFAIAKMLRSEVSKNVKLIGEKTKGKKGFFGLGLGGILSLLGLLTNPIVLGVLGIGAAGAGIGFLTAFLFNNRDKIIGFIMDKTRGLYDFLLSFVSDIVSDFLGDTFKSNELRNVEEESEERIKSSKKDFIDEGILPNEAQFEAVNNEIEFLNKEISDIDSKQFTTSKDDKRRKALENRRNELQTGEVTTDKMDFLTDSFFGKNIRNALKRQPVFLEDESYADKSNPEKIITLKSLASKFQRQGNSLDTIKQIYQRALNTNQVLADDGKMRDLTPDEIVQANDMIRFADQIQASGNRSIPEDEFTAQPKDKKISSSSTSNSGNGFSGGGETGGGSGDGASTAFNPNSGGSDLAQVPVSAEGTPSFVDHINFDPENDFVDFNAAMFNIFNA